MQTSRALTRSLVEDITHGRLQPGARLAPVRRLAELWGCAPGTVAKAYVELRTAGLVEGAQRSSLRVAAEGTSLARGWPGYSTQLRLAGSDDPALDLLVSVHPGVTFVPGRRGSVHGLGELARGSADAATLHLFQAANGSHNDDFVRGIVGGEPVTLAHLWRRQQVLVLPAGNPLDIAGVADLAGRRLAWRDAGAGSRLLLERLLAEAGVAAEPGRGVRADSHRGVAIAVATGAADAGVAVQAAAEAVGAAWLPLSVEPFELAVRDRAVPAALRLLETLADPRFRARVEALGGYDLSAAGQLRRVA